MRSVASISCSMCDGEIVTHASVVERELHLGDTPVRTGYVEAVATDPSHQGLGYGSLVMTDVTAHIRERFELGALGTGRHHFYERLGWRTWQGPTFLRTADGPRRTVEDDGYLLVLETPGFAAVRPRRAHLVRVATRRRLVGGTVGGRVRAAGRGAAGVARGGLLAADGRYSCA